MLKRYALLSSLFIIFFIAFFSGCSIEKEAAIDLTDSGNYRQLNGEKCEENTHLLTIYNPVYSLDDSFIFFTGNCKNKSSIYRINSDGSGLKKLTKPFGYDDTHPIVLPNHKILFTSYEDRESCPDLCTMNIDGSNPIWLTKNGTGGNWPSYSPDGKTIYAVSSCLRNNFSINQNTYDIYAMELGGIKRRKITEFKDFFIRQLSISPDGEFLLFQRQSFKKHPRDESIWILSIKEDNKFYPLKPDIYQFLSNYKELKIKNKEHWTETYSNMNSPQFSPDGNSILFVWPGHYQGYFGHELYLMDIKSRSTKKITDLRKYIVAPSFSHDGKTIIFTVGTDYINSRPNHFELWKMNIDGTGIEKINLSN